MKEWFKSLFHHHIWDIVDRGPITQDHRQIGTFYTLRCRTCGKMKIKNLM